MAADKTQNLKGVERLLGIMDALRDPQTGCPWDLKQDFKSIAPYTLEEVYELIECIETDDFEELENELGDVLFQVVFYARLGKEQGRFDFDSVAMRIAEKLERRHPHVFKTQNSTISTEEVKHRWEEIKQNERAKKQQTGLLDDVPLSLTGLQRAAKLQKRAANVGFDWDAAEAVLPIVEQELAELRQAIDLQDNEAIKEEIGDVFFSLVNLSRKLKLEPEQVLRQANRKFESRIRHMEQQAGGQDGLASMELEQLEGLWQAAKQAE